MERPGRATEPRLRPLRADPRTQGPARLLPVARRRGGARARGDGLLLLDVAHRGRARRIGARRHPPGGAAQHADLRPRAADGHHVRSRRAARARAGVAPRCRLLPVHQRRRRPHLPPGRGGAREELPRLDLPRSRFTRSRDGGDEDPDRHRRGAHQLECLRDLRGVHLARLPRLLLLLPRLRHRAAEGRPPPVRASSSSCGPRWSSGPRASARTAGWCSPSASPRWERPACSRAVRGLRAARGRPGDGELRAPARGAALRRRVRRSPPRGAAGAQGRRSPLRGWRRRQDWWSCSCSAR